MKLPRLDGWNAARAGLADRYREALAADRKVTVAGTADWADPVWHLFVVNLAERDRCAARLAEQGMTALVHYPLLPHLSPPYREAGWRPGDFPVAEALAESALSLPMYPQLDPAQCERVAVAVLNSS